MSINGSLMEIVMVLTDSIEKIPVNKQIKYAFR